MAYKTILDLLLKHFSNVVYIVTVNNPCVVCIVIIYILKFHLKASKPSLMQGIANKGRKFTDVRAGNSGL